MLLREETQCFRFLTLCDVHIPLRWQRNTFSVNFLLVIFRAEMTRHLHVHVVLALCKFPIIHDLLLIFCQWTCWYIQFRHVVCLKARVTRFVVTAMSVLMHLGMLVCPKARYRFYQYVSADDSLFATMSVMAYLVLGFLDHLFHLQNCNNKQSEQSFVLSVFIVFSFEYGSIFMQHMHINF